jgi:hypothetical protein
MERRRDESGGHDREHGRRDGVFHLVSPYYQLSYGIEHDVHPPNLKQANPAAFLASEQIDPVTFK